MDFPGYNLNDAADCKAALQLNDRFIRKYMHWMDRYAELPAREALVLSEARKEFPAQYCDYLESLGTTAWLPPPGDPMQGYGDPDQPPPEEAANGKGDDENGGDSEEAGESKEGKSLRRRLDMSANAIAWSLICVMMDWSNIYSVALPPPKRKDGLRILTTLGMCLGNFHSSMFQLGCFQVQMAVLLCRRVQTLLETCASQLEQCGNAPSMQGLKEIIDSRCKTLRNTAGNIDAHITLCQQMNDISEW